ncbi:uncharacterized protein LOC110818075 [Carica papaya]|uniref:uncharacterized protein LOC110818075 n=1 Tax=Carica papaya TaxID=3649 RepID=UPI000B8C7EF0|nr:uncharacterized protein LOC110818075 [Carica papaya]
MKLFNRFRKIVTRLIFSFPSSHHHNTSSSSSSGKTRQKNCDRFDLPKTSCSSYYSSHSHYDEAIADCIEFFNKSAQDGRLFYLLWKKVAEMIINVCDICVYHMIVD